MSIEPIFDYIPIDSPIAKINDAVSISPTPSITDRRDPHLLVIKSEWRIVLNHPTFSVEYKQYICK